MRTLTPIPILTLAMALILGACSLVGGGPTLTPTNRATGQPSAAPPASPTPTTPPKAVVLISNAADGFPSERLRSTLGSLTEETGFELLEVSGSSPDDVPPWAQIIVTSGGADELAAIRQSAPDAQVILIGALAAADDPAVTTISMDADLRAELAFAAGYTAAMLTDDYRVGLVLPAEMPEVSLAFTNGYQYYCGLCRAVYPPYESYPASVVADPGDPTAAAQSLADRSVQTAYVVGSALTTGSIQALTDAGIAVLGESTEHEASATGWLATIRPAPEQALAELWPQLLDGRPPSQVAAPLVVEDRAENVLTEGKLRLVRQLLDDLQAGWIDTGVTEP